MKKKNNNKLLSTKFLEIFAYESYMKRVNFIHLLKFKALTARPLFLLYFIIKKKTKERKKN